MGFQQVGEASHKTNRVVRSGGLFGAGLMLFALAGCAVNEARGPVAEAPGVAPPMAEQRPYTVTAPHGASRVDPWYWLRDDTREDPQVLAYLAAENAYTDAQLAPLEALESTLYDEIVGRIKQDDSSVPYRKNGYWYYSRFEEGSEYPVYARRAGSMEADEQVMLDVNLLAADSDYYQVGNWQVSPNSRMLAYAEDTVGRRQFTLRFKDLDTGQVLPDTIPGVSAGAVWANDNRTVLYVENDPVTLLGKRVKQHVLGTPVGSDRLVYEETDPSFYMGVFRTTSDEYLCIGVSSTVSSEQRCADADAPTDFRIIAGRERDIEYRADHLGDAWIILTNWQAPNFRLMQVGDGQWESRSAWQELLPHDPEVFLQDFSLFDEFIVLDERSDALRRLRVMPEAGASFFVRSDEPAYTMGLSTNAEPDTDWLRYSYTSLTTPSTIYEINVESGERRLLKQEPVLGDFDSNDYVTERVWATARDGVRVPVSVAYRRGFERHSGAPLLQYAYGSYGASMDPRFNSTLLSLMDRGVVYAIAHIRGGQELGRSWYDDGKLLNKINTFNDFIDVTDHLMEAGYAGGGRVVAYGGSAGGLLMGAIANMAPQKYAAIVAAVPFVDVVTTMLDETIPLTTNEFDEWGNPADPTYYDYMLSYSPYDQVRAQEYPPMLVTTGLWDSQVQYFEPAKWVARLRTLKTDDNPLLLRTEMEAGHGGKSGRFRRYREIAEVYAFMLDRLDAN